MDVFLSSFDDTSWFKADKQRKKYIMLQSNLKIKSTFDCNIYVYMYLPTFGIRTPILEQILELSTFYLNSEVFERQTLYSIPVDGSCHLCLSMNKIDVYVC